MVTAKQKTKSKPALSPAIIFPRKLFREAGTGKLSIINSFQKFYGPTFPFIIPPFVVTVSIGQLSGKLDKLKLSIEILAADGKRIIPPVVAEVGTEGEVSPEDIFEFSFPIPPCEFSAPGAYKVRFIIADEAIGTRTLPILKMPEAKSG